MKQSSMNNKLKELYKIKYRTLEKEYDELIDVMMKQKGAPTLEQIVRKNYLESELFILETNKQ